MSSVALSRTASTEEGQFNNSKAVTTDGKWVKNPILPAAIAGTLTTRTSATAGTVTLSAGHGIVTGDRIDIFWATGQGYGASVGTVAGDDVPFTGLIGTLPADESPVTVMKPQQEIFPAIDADCQAIIAGSSVRANIVLTGTAGAVVLPIMTSGQGDAYIWDISQGANPMTADATHVYLSHSDSSGPRQVSVIAYTN